MLKANFKRDSKKLEKFIIDNIINNYIPNEFVFTLSCIELNVNGQLIHVVK